MGINTRKTVITLVVALMGVITYSLYGYNAELLGLYPTRPSNFFKTTLGVSSTIGWIIFYCFILFFSILYYKFKSRVKIKSTTLKGFVFGAVMFLIFTELLVAVLNSLAGLPKESHILMKSLSYLIAHIIFGITIAHAYEILLKKFLK